MIQSVALKPTDYIKFQSFLKLPEKSFTKGEIPVTKLRRIRFLEWYILPNRNLFKHSGAQLCTTRIGEHLGVSAQTVMNWIKCLLRNRCLSVADKHWKKGFVSRKYIANFENDAFTMALNEYNGYGTTVERVSQNKQLKYEFRKKAWARFDWATPTKKSITFLASTYLGCPKQFRDEIISRIPLSALKAPSLTNAYKPYFYDFYRALRFVTRDRNKNHVGDDFAYREFPMSDSFDDFVGDSLERTHYSRDIFDDEEAEELRKLSLVVKFDIRNKIEKANGRKKKRLKEFLKAWTWASYYRTDKDVEDFDEFAPYHSWEKLI